MLIRTCGRGRHLLMYNPRMAKASLGLIAIQDCIRRVEATEACPSHLARCCLCVYWVVFFSPHTLFHDRMTIWKMVLEKKTAQVN